MCDYCSWINKLLDRPRVEPPPTVCTNVIDDHRSDDVKTEKIVKFVPTILVHGTANSSASRKAMNALLERIEEAAIKAYRELITGAESLDSVELAIRSLEGEKWIEDLEDNENKSVRNKLPLIRNAAMMDSETNAGSVGAVTNNDHPITLAKKVLRNTDHVLIVENGIKNLDIDFGDSCQLDNCSGERVSRISTVSNAFDNVSVNTGNVEDSMKKKNEGIQIYVAIARDRKGRLACGISTYDDRSQSIERSSMSAAAVLGCGLFADVESCCTVSSANASIYFYAPACKIVARLKREISMKRENSTDVLIDTVLKDELKKFMEATGEGSVGAAALCLEGEARVAFEGLYFPWACCNLGVITSGCVRDEVFSKDVKDLNMPLDCECH